MREIKFRAWHKKLLAMGTFSEEDPGEYEWVREGILRCSQYSLQECIDSEFIELMQYTCLNDGRGVEIYEGDILAIEGLGTCKVIICPHYGVCVINRHLHAAPLIDSTAENDTFKVIGNIYECPELL